MPTADERDQLQPPADNASFTATAPPTPPPLEGGEWTLKMTCDYLRAELKNLEMIARRLKDHSTFKGEQSFVGQHGEMIAQSMLAVRHMEDARMRIGKVLQYSRDGVSIYDQA